jgi:hypothetical protein
LRAERPSEFKNTFDDLDVDEWHADLLRVAVVDVSQSVSARAVTLHRRWLAEVLLNRAEVEYCVHQNE